MRTRATRMNGRGGATTAVAAAVAAIIASTASAAWYDPSDLSTMYQDNFAQTAVTAVEQPVGFILDKSKGGMPRGADVVLNGTFDSGLTDWTTPVAAPGTVTLVGTRAVLDSGIADGGGVSRLRQLLTVTPGWYEITFDVAAFSGIAANAQLQLGSTLGGSDYSVVSAGANGTQRKVFYVSTTALGIAFFATAATTRTTYSLDNVSIKPLGGANLWTGAPTVNNGTWIDNADGSYTNAGNTGTIGYTGRLVIGKTYEAFVRVLSRTAGTFYVPYDGVGPNAIIVSTVSTYRRVFTATTTSLYIYSNAFNGTVASVHVQELPTLIPLTQATSTARPVLAARVNFLTQTESLTNAAWLKTQVGIGSAPTVTDNYGVAPDGTTTAHRVQMAINGSTSTADYSMLSQVQPVLVGGTYSSGVWLKTADGSTKTMIMRDDFGTPALSTLITVTPDWQFFSQVNRQMTNTSSTTVKLWLRGGQGTSDSVDILFWHPQFETGPTLGAYQRVGASTDYDWLGWPLYLRFDGTDDSMSTGGAGGTTNFDLTGTDKVNVFAGVHKSSDAAFGDIVELSATSATNPGTFMLAGPSDAATGNYRFDLTADIASPAGFRAVTFTAPISNVLSVAYDIAGAARATEVFPRINGAVPTLTAAGVGVAGVGNFGTYPLYVGARAGASLRFNGRIYQLLILGRAVTPDELFITERFVGQKMGIAL